MGHRIGVGLVAALVSFAATGCIPIVVDVKERHPSPRRLLPRFVEDVRTYQVRPPGSVAVFSLQAAGEHLEEVETAVRRRAAHLGCDGIMFTVREDQSTSAGIAQTGKLNPAREYVDAHMDALCIVDPAALPPDCPRPEAPAAPVTPARPAAPAAPAPAAAPDPAEIDAAARRVVEQWREAYDRHSGAALAVLYAHDAGLRVVSDGAVLRGWAEVESALRERLAQVTAIRVRIADVQIPSVGATAVVIAQVQRERTGAATEDGIVTLVLRAAPAGDPAGWVIVAEHFSSRRA
jgi:ketosteroid isomerase-like protein